MCSLKEAKIYNAAMLNRPNICATFMPQFFFVSSFVLKILPEACSSCNIWSQCEMEAAPPKTTWTFLEQ